MARPKPDKTDLLFKLADHVLTHGLNTASLRPMAAAAGTSDRMLIYHFGSKAGLIAELLHYLAEEMAVRLDAALPERRWASEAALVRDVVTLLRSDPFRAYIRVWLDIVSAAAQGQTAHRASSAAIVEMYLDWLSRRHPQGRDGAQFALTLIEGVVVMDAAGCPDVADRALRSLP